MVAPSDNASRPSSSRPTLSQSAPQTADNRRDRRQPKLIRPNDRFVKVAELLEAAQTVWVVWHFIEQPGLPRHVRLIQENDPKRSVTVAVSALTDRRLYRRLDPAPAPVGADQRVVIDAADPPMPRENNLVPLRRAGRDPDGAPPTTGRASDG